MLPFSLTEKLIGGVALLVLLGLLIWAIHHDGYRDGVLAADARMQALVDEANLQAIATETAAQARVNTLEKDHAEKVADLDARLAGALGRAPIVRVQKCPGGSSVSAAAAAAGDNTRDANGSGPAREDGGDIAPILLRYARDAEQLRLAVAACKAYGAEIERLRVSTRDSAPRAPAPAAPID